MQVGDLVTLSQYAQNLTSISRRYKPCLRDRSSNSPLIGIITEVAGYKGYSWQSISVNESVRYKVQWNEQGLEGRGWRENYFHRNDLKYIR